MRRAITLGVGLAFVMLAGGTAWAAVGGTFVTAVVVPGAEGQPDRIDYTVNVIVSPDDNQGLWLFAYDMLTDVGVRQPEPEFARTEIWWDGQWSHVDDLPCFFGGFGADNAGLPVGGVPVEDDILGAGTSGGTCWDADLDGNPDNGRQPSDRAGVGQCFYFGDPCGPHDGEFVNGGRWPHLEGSIVLRDNDGRNAPPGIHHAEFVPLLMHVIREDADLTQDLCGHDLWEEVPVENLFGSVLEFTVTEDGRIVDLLIQNELHMVADFDCDGDVDISDFGFFSACFAGSGVPVDEGCLPADADGDGDVDIADFALLAGDFTGSQ